LRIISISTVSRVCTTRVPVAVRVRMLSTGGTRVEETEAEVDETTCTSTPQHRLLNTVHPGLQVTPQTVAEGLAQGDASKCPFLHNVAKELQAQPAQTQNILNQGGEPAAKYMRQVIDKAMQDVLLSLRQQKRYREFRYFKRSVGQHPEVQRLVADNTVSTSTTTTTSTSTSPTLINWCSNDYLNLGHHPDVISAMTRTLQEQGAAAGGTRNISGSNVLHVELERELAELAGTEAALLFSSCYVANLGVFEALSQALSKETIIFSDKENHASLVQGIRNIRLKKMVFEHNNADQLEEQLASAPANVPKVVVFETVYSMSGTRSPTARLLSICEHYGAVSVVDEVHAVGLYGSQGGGILDELNLLGRADIVTGTLGKAFGVSGGFVAGRAHWIDVIRSTAPSFIFTTSLSPVVAAGALAAVRLVRRSPLERDQMHKTASYLKQNMLAAGLPLMSTETHILPLLVGDGDVCKALSDELLSRNIYVQPINYPSVPRGEELLRVTAGPKHTREHCDHLIDNLVDICGARGLLRNNNNHQTEHEEKRRVVGARH